MIVIVILGFPSPNKVEICSDTHHFCLASIYTHNPWGHIVGDQHIFEAQLNIWVSRWIMRCNWITPKVFMLQSLMQKSRLFCKACLCLTRAAFRCLIFIYTVFGRWYGGSVCTELTGNSQEWESRALNMETRRTMFEPDFATMWSWARHSTYEPQLFISEMGMMIPLFLGLIIIR